MVDLSCILTAGEACTVASQRYSHPQDFRTAYEAVFFPYRFPTKCALEGCPVILEMAIAFYHLHRFNSLA